MCKKGNESNWQNTAIWKGVQQQINIKNYKELEDKSAAEEKDYYYMNNNNKLENWKAEKN